MKKSIFMVCSLFAAATMLFSCAEDATQTPMDANASPATRVGNPAKVMAYVETNNINPLNVLKYLKPDGKPFVDILNIFAANINADTNGDPCIHFNQELAPIMNNCSTDIQPIRNAGIEVLLTLLPNWQHVGPASLSGEPDDPNSQVRKFAKLVAYVICTKCFDGVALDDEWADYYSTVPGSYGRLLLALRIELDAHCPGKKISVFQYGNISQINAVSGAVNAIDYSDYSQLAPTSYGSNQINGLPNSKFFPVAINLGVAPSSLVQGTIRSNARRVITEGKAGVMGFNMRDGSSTNSTLTIFNLWAQGFAGVTSGTYVTWVPPYYPQRTPFIPGGVNITNADVPSNF